MNLRRSFFILFLCAVILASGWRIYRVISDFKHYPARSPNVLIISLCSLRPDALSEAPQLSQFFEKSTFLFKNAYNGLGWIKINNFLFGNLSPAQLSLAGFDALNSNSYSLRVPPRQDAIDPSVDNNNYEKRFENSDGNLENLILNKRERPFFAVVHFKYLHYPLIDHFNKEAAWDRFLNQEERIRLDDYLKNFKHHYQKLPFVLLLTNDPSYVFMHPQFAVKKPRDRSQWPRWLGLMTNSDILAQWKTSEGYLEDLKILKKVYRANLQYLDKKLGPLLNLYGDKKLQQNTIVMIVSDHGELHMEYDELTHGTALWDKALHLAAAIRFPHAQVHEVIEEQVDMVSLARVIQDIIEGANSPELFKEALVRRQPEVTIARNCTHSLRGLRYKNQGLSQI